ncbi:MAG TPA: CBS domain-containing protein [Polyangium sp.]|nr:CBS domain-containing protein [Polyangium sp.]
MKCAELMKKDVECSRSGDSVQSVAEKMRDRNIGFMPVCNDKGVAIGTVTDRDLTLRVLADKRSADTRVEDVMSRDVVSCGPEDELTSAEELMSKHKKSRMLVADDKGCPLGVISLSDIAKAERGGRASAILRSVAQRESHT